MHWNITNVVRNIVNGLVSTITIDGYSTDNNNTYFTCLITRTTLDNALNIAHDYHEGYSLAVVNPDEVYIIDILISDNDADQNMNLRNMPFVSADELAYFNNPLYMGLPPAVFAQWKGLMNTNL